MAQRTLTPPNLRSQKPTTDTRPPTTDPMQAPPEVAFAPMPLRERGVLENLDVAIKAFKQYFWVLVGWAAIVNGINSIPGVSYFSYFFTPPLMIGAAACCVAAAVRGQRVSFAQCWRFTQPRFWSIVGMHVCALLVAGVLIGILIAIAVLLAIGGAYVFSSAPGNISAIIAIVASVIGLIFFSVAVTAIGAWNTLVGIVACMEDDKRNTRALARAFELMRGHWRPIISLMMLLGMGILVLWMIIGAAGLLMGGLTTMKDLFNGTPSDSNALLALAGFFFSTWLVLTLYTPIHYLAMTLVYLDLRVRKEALDIEWTAHQTAPEPGAAWDTSPAQPASFEGMPAQWSPSMVGPPAPLSADPSTLPSIQSTSSAPDAFATAATAPSAQPIAPNSFDLPIQSTLAAPSMPAIDMDTPNGASPDLHHNGAAIPSPDAALPVAPVDTLQNGVDGAHTPEAPAENTPRW